MKTKKINGCTGGLYMTRIILVETRWGKLMINIFHQSDEDRFLHDHPWEFWSLILWRGYIEHTKNDARFIRPFSINHRPAKWLHRVSLIKNKPAVTLVLTGKRTREWGFATDKGWVGWEKYHLDYCED